MVITRVPIVLGLIDEYFNFDPRKPTVPLTTRLYERPSDLTMARYNAFAGTTVALAAVFIPLALVFIVLRIIARSRTKANVGLDDLLAVFTLVIYICYSALCLSGT